MAGLKDLKLGKKIMKNIYAYNRNSEQSIDNFYVSEILQSNGFDAFVFTCQGTFFGYVACTENDFPKLKEFIETLNNVELRDEPIKDPLIIQYYLKNIAVNPEKFKAKAQEGFNTIKDKISEIDVDKIKDKVAAIDINDAKDKVIEKSQELKVKVSEIDFDEVKENVTKARKEIKDKVSEINLKPNKDLIFKNMDSLQQVVNVVNESAFALNDSDRTIKESAISEVLVGALGAGIGGVGSFAALYGLGMAGLSAAGITSGLAAAGAVVGGGMVAGIFVLAAPIAVLAAGGVGVATHLKNKQLQQEKERLYKEVLKKHEAIIQALKEESNATQERLDYLQSLNILLQKAIEDLSKDLASV